MIRITARPGRDLYHGRIAFDYGIAFRPDPGSRVDDDHVAIDHAVEKPPQGGLVELLGRNGDVQLLEIIV